MKVPSITGDGQAIVRPLVIGRCDLDIGFVHGLMPMKSGAPIGHEIVGTVVDIGDDVTVAVPGDLVVVAGQISCGKCRNCLRGFTGRCMSVPFGASYGMGREGDFGGGAADLVKVPYAENMMFPLPKDSNPAEWIGFADMAQDAFRAVGPQLKQRPGARVLVIGGLPSVIGIYTAGLAVALGAAEVDYYDDDDTRLAEAGAYGANPIQRGSKEPQGMYEIVVDSSIEPHALIEAFRFTEPAGLVTSVSVHRGELAEAPFMEAYHKGISYQTGRPNCRQHMEELSNLCCSGKFNPAAISSKEFAFDDAPQAWLDHHLRTYAARD